MSETKPIVKIKEEPTKKADKSPIQEGLSGVEQMMQEKLPDKIWLKLKKGMRFLYHQGRSKAGTLKPYRLSEHTWTEIREKEDIAYFTFKVSKGAKFKIQKTEPASVIKARKEHKASKPKEKTMGEKLAMGVKL